MGDGSLRSVIGALCHLESPSLEKSRSVNSLEGINVLPEDGSLDLTSCNAVVFTKMVQTVTWIPDQLP